MAAAETQGKVGPLGWAVGIGVLLLLAHRALTDDTKGSLSNLTTRRRRRRRRR